MILSSIRTALQTNLKTADSALRCYDVWPDQIHTPCVLVKPLSSAFSQVSGDLVEVEFEVIVLAAATQQGLEIGERLLDAYLNNADTKSLRKAIESDRTLGGYAQEVYVREWRDYGSLVVSDIEYIGVKLSVTVWA